MRIEDTRGYDGLEHEGADEDGAAVAWRPKAPRLAQSYAERVEWVAARVLAALVGAQAAYGAVDRRRDAYAEHVVPADMAARAVQFATALVHEIDAQADRADDLAREARERRP